MPLRRFLSPMKLILFDKIEEKHRISLSANTPKGDVAIITISEPGKAPLSNINEPVITLTKR